MDMKRSDSKMTPVIDFYNGKSIFITGGTGFVGLVLVEKLLYACEGINNLYLLIRPKGGKTATNRLTELLMSSAFQRLKRKKPEFLEKIVPVHGDLKEDCLGIKPEEQATVCEQASIVFHVAADINFDSTLKDTLEINAKGTLNVLGLCHKMRHLEAFIHVSSAYSNCNRNFIAEKVYPTLAPLDVVYHILENAPENHLVKNVLDKRPNNYTYAKAVAEELVVNEHGLIPTAIVRPTIITSSNLEPARGWVDSWGGANGVTVSMGKGLLRAWPAGPDAIGDIIPVDIVTNLMIAAAWDAHLRDYRGDKEVKVFNCSSGLQNPVTVGRFMNTCLHYTRKYPFRDVLCYPTIVVTTNRLINVVLTILLQILPALIIDAICWMFRFDSGLMKLQRKVLKLRSVLEYFTLHEFTFLDYNVSKLYETMTKEDKMIFDFNVKNIDWDTYLEAYVVGIRKYLLKEEPDEISKE